MRKTMRYKFLSLYLAGVLVLPVIGYIIYRVFGSSDLLGVVLSISGTMFLFFSGIALCVYWDEEVEGKIDN